MARTRICNKCGLQMSPIFSQTSNKIVGYICKNSHITFTPYGQGLLNTQLEVKESCEDSDAIPQKHYLLHQH